MAHDDEHGHKAAAAVPEWAPPAFGPSKMPWLEVEDVTCFCCVKVSAPRSAGPAPRAGGTLAPAPAAS